MDSREIPISKSRVEAEDGPHAATRGDRAGQRREAYAAGIEAAVVSDRDVPSSPVKAFFLPLDSLRFAPLRVRRRSQVNIRPMCGVQDSFKHWTTARRRIDYPIRHPRPTRPANQ